LEHRFPFAATPQALPHSSLSPEAKAPVKPDALQTLARASYYQACPLSPIHLGIPWRSQQEGQTGRLPPFE